MLKIEIDFTNVVSFELEGHLVLLRKNASSIQILNPLAKLIWEFKKSGLSDRQIAEEVSGAFSIPFELAQQDVRSINAQWLLDLASDYNDEVIDKKTLPIVKDLNYFKVSVVAFFSFPGLSIKVNFACPVIAEKVRHMFSLCEVPEVDETVAVQFDVIFFQDTYIIVKDGVVLEQTETKSYTAQIVCQHVIDFVCKKGDWLTILHAAGVSWEGQGIVFPALGGSGKTTLTAALIKHGFDYINDDVIPLLRNTGELVPLPVNMSIKSGSWPLLKHLYPEIEGLEVFGSQEPRVKYLSPPMGNNLPSTIYTKYIIVLNYQAGASAELEPLNTIAALQAIIVGESLLRLPLKKEDIADLIEWLKPLECLRLSYDKLDSAVDLLRQFCIDNKN